MNPAKILIIVSLVVFSITSCKKETTEIDKQKPEIIINIDGTFPLNCDTLYFGETFNVKMLFSDNFELGSYSIDIHNNFDHHSHSTEVTECQLNPIKTPINPFTYINDFTIPVSQKQYQTNLPILIPTENENGIFDEGDYHFFISLTDKEGWSTQKGFSIKILKR
jgi:hypothetical protein